MIHAFLLWLRGWRKCPYTNGIKQCPYYRRKEQEYCAIHLSFQSIDLKNSLDEYFRKPIEIQEG
jgi:hypothetical protein